MAIIIILICSMVTDHCTLLLADSALSHTSSASMPNSQADSDINMPLDHLTPGSQPSPPVPHHHPMTNGYHGNIDTPTLLELPKK